MAGLKRKTREGKRDNKGRDFKKKNQRSSRRKRAGPRLPNAMLKELQLPKRYADFDDEEIGSDDVAVNDLYEYEKEIAEEESRKNRRFDPVENYQYELPDEFESFDDIASAPGSKTSFEVSIFADDSWKKMNDSSAKGKQTKSANAKSANSLRITEPVESKPDGEIISLYAESTMQTFSDLFVTIDS